MRGYLVAHAAKQHERRFGWKTFRVLTVTTDNHRAQSTTEALRQIRVSAQPWPVAVFLRHTRRAVRRRSAFATRGRTATAATCD